MNLPILLHVFERFKGRRFIVIGDYRHDALRGYLENVAEERYFLVRASETGNAAGIRDSLKMIPDGSPFLLLWCDLLLPPDLDPTRVPVGNYIGTTGDFPCSWSFLDGKPEKAPGRRGVAGLFIFEDKSALANLPASGSFAAWLSAEGPRMSELPLEGCMEVGTLEALRALTPAEGRCRPYNRMEFGEDFVVKTAVTPEGEALLERERLWYRRMSEYGFSNIPKIHGYHPLTMERVRGVNVFSADLGADEKRGVVDNIVSALRALHDAAPTRSDVFDMQEDYYLKTLRRLRGIRDVIPFADAREIIVNGASCRNVLFYEEEFQRAVLDLFDGAVFGPIHGDCTLTNTMVDGAGNIYFIDPRGYFGKTAVIGDADYDWAKLYYSIAGNFDQFNVGNFSLSIGEDSVAYKIESNGWEDLTEYFLTKAGIGGTRRIKLLHAIIWLSLASHCRDVYDSLCLAFYNGLWLWGDAMRGR
jgi:aminoglycoside phosphotransferase